MLLGCCSPVTCLAWNKCTRSPPYVSCSGCQSRCLHLLLVYSRNKFHHLQCFYSIFCNSRSCIDHSCDIGSSKCCALDVRRRGGHATSAESLYQSHSTTCDIGGYFHPLNFISVSYEANMSVIVSKLAECMGSTNTRDLPNAPGCDAPLAALFGLDARLLDQSVPISASFQVSGQ